TAWERCHGSIARFEQEAESKAIRAEIPEYASIHAHVLHDVLARLEKTFHAFFRRLANGQKPGFPRDQGRERWHCFTDTESGNGARLDNGALVLSKIGRSAVRWSRPSAGTIKTVTVSRAADGWYVCCSCAGVPPQPLPLTGRATGIDVGLKVFLVTAEAEVVANPRPYRQAEQRLQKAQRRVARRKRGSTRRKKAVHLLRRTQQQVRRQRRDFHHKMALALVRRYDVIYLEDLRVRNLRRSPEPQPDSNGGYRHTGAGAQAGLNKSIHDAGWSAFRIILACKAAWAGTRVEAVPPAYTSQDCSGCGERVRKSLSVRTHVCPTCGLSVDRDANAALNSQWRGQRLRGLAGVPAGVNREPTGL
ncbi:MAG TPA: transposase, partial [Ktedonobacterales bacterium]|nr:transposase [Ktedonobacterales bacterium]